MLRSTNNCLSFIDCFNKAQTEFRPPFKERVTLRFNQFAINDNKYNFFFSQLLGTDCYYRMSVDYFKEEH